MPRLNDYTQATTGYNRSWYDQTRTVYQDCTSGKCHIVLSDGTVVYDDGDVAYIYANGKSQWVAFSPPKGVFNNIFVIPEAGLTRALDPVGPDGSVTYKVKYQSYGPWKIRHSDGSDGPTFGGDCQDVSNLGDDKVIWTEQGILYGLGVTVPPVKCYYPRYKDGHLLYQAQQTGELILDGHVIGPSKDYFRSDFIARNNGTFLVVWSSGEGESDVQQKELTAAELAALPMYAEPYAFTFAPFNHPVFIAPFKAEGSGARDIFSFGIYTEAIDLFGQSLQGQRLLLAHDSILPWTLPVGLHKSTIPLIEFYRVPEETLLQSVARWRKSEEKLLADWPYDCGVIPMFYTQYRWSIDEVLDGLKYLPELVNLSPRIKFVAPFSYNRANGIVSDPRLLAAFESLKAATPGDPVLIPIETNPAPTPTPPSNPEPTKPSPQVPTFSLIERLKLMNPEIVSIVCFDHYARVLNGKVVFDQTTESTETDWEVSKPDDRFAIRPVSNTSKYLGMDSTTYGNDICKQFYLTDNRGNYEAFFIGKSPNGLLLAFIEYITQGVNNTVPFTSAAITIKRKAA
jgi:hypothetical protein